MGVWLAGITPALCRDELPMEEHIPGVTVIPDTLWPAALDDIPAFSYFP